MRRRIHQYSQNFNRYSYVLNNPLNKTDPSGYSWLSKAFDKIGNWFSENWRTVVSIVVGVVLFFALGLGAFGVAGLGLQGAQLGAAVGASMGAFNAAINGGNLGDIAKGALIGGIQGGITGGILHGMEGVAEMSGQWYDKAAHIVGHGVVGGAANEAMGGKFQDGFLSAAAGAYAGWTLLKNTTIGNTLGSTVGGRTAIAGVVGGTASAIGGGKFANGAWTAAFQHLLNNEMVSKLDQSATKKRVGDYLKFAQATKTPYLNEEILNDLLQYQLLGMMDDPYEGGILGWISYTKSQADSPFHFNGLEDKEFYFVNRTGDRTLPTTGIYRGSDINYYAVGMSLGQSRSPLLTIGAVTGWNYGQAFNEWVRNGYSAKWWHNSRQMVSAQPWARAGFSFYMKNYNRHFEGYE